MDVIGIHDSTEASKLTTVANVTGNESLNDSVVRDLLNDHILLPPENTVAIGLVFLYIPAFLAGFIGNGLLILIILSKRRLRNGTNLFLCNLAVADLCVTVICIPVAVGRALYRIWIYGEFMCKMTGFLQGVTVAASVFTITLLSVDRFLAIRHPIIFRRLSTNAMATKLILVVWLISIALMTPLFIVRQISVVDIIPEEPVHFCGEIWQDHQRLLYDVVLFVIVYIIPGIVICVCYGLIGSELWRKDRDLKRTESETSQGLAKQMMKGRKRVAKMLIALAVLFAVCWLPYFCVNLYLDFHSDTNVLVALPYTIFLGHSNSALNPILYFYSSKSFRCVLVRMFTCKQRRFKPVRQENMLVRCTRNSAGGTTAALTRRPFVKMLSSGSPVSRSGSQKFSRSSNNSLKSTSGTHRTSFKSATTNRNSEYQRPYKEKLEHVKETKHATINPNIEIIEPALENLNDLPEKTYHKKSFMEATISIPTTINEESSRHNSLVPQPKLTPTPSMVAIYEEPRESSGNITDKGRIELQTFAIITRTVENCQDLAIEFIDKRLPDTDKRIPEIYVHL